MNEDTGWARRYHWLGDSVDDFVCEPHAAIQDLTAEKDAEPDSVATPTDGQETPQCGPESGSDTGAKGDLLKHGREEADQNRTASAALIREKPDWLCRKSNAVPKADVVRAGSPFRSCTWTST